MFNVILGLFSALVSKWFVNSKTAGCRAKRSVILEFGCSCTTCMYVGIFDLLKLNVSLGPFGAFVSKWPATWKRLAVERD